MIIHFSQVIERRKDLKLILSSATIEVEKFQRFFRNPPIFTVEGRLYKIKTSYNPCGYGQKRPENAGTK